MFVCLSDEAAADAAPDAGNADGLDFDPSPPAGEDGRIYMFIYIYIYRERERVSICIYIYIYV